MDPKPRTYFRVAKLGDYQHYKDRRPAWVKLHRHVLESYDFGRLQDASKWLALGCILLASESENRIPWDEEWIARRLQMTTKPNLNDLLSGGFIELCDPASNLLATCYGFASLETETETEEEKETTPTPPSPSAPVVPAPRRLAVPKARPASPAEPDWFEAAWSAYPARPNNSKAEARRAYAKRIAEGTDPAAILAGVVAYAAFCEKTGVFGNYRKQAATFFGPDRHWESDYTVVAPPSPQDAELQAIADEASGGYSFAERREVA